MEREPQPVQPEISGVEAAPENRDLTKEQLLSQVRKHNDESFSVEMPHRTRFESVRHVFPRFISEQVELDIALIEDAAAHDLNHAKLEIIAQALAADRHERESLDPLTGLYTQKYVKEVLTEKLNEQIINPEVNDFKHIIRLSIDMNGLKAVNDYNDGMHSKGDEYLRLVAEGLRQSPTIDRLRLRGARVIIAREHGDDFSITVIGTAQETYDRVEIADALKKEIQAVRIPDDVLSKDVIEHKIGAAPAGFTFYPSAGVGSITVEEILNEKLLREKNKPRETDTPKRIAQKIMGSMMDVSEERMKDDKDAFKKNLAEGSAIDHYYLKAMSPRDVELVETIEEKQRQIEALKQQIAQLNRTEAS